ncbi:hypothetical protein BC936DRAFT_139599 [Jimgerdemannia flammicorona]|uniref:Uncharacterized protein n=1 Tax=Jimgerdemannia flammicorona TaxID=994334 RepID=A0A433B9L2_9FUNG|nr:hypothetical protein BC936DRAFT_139599 [Jimgerdemannia flammicorona]
MADHRKRPTTPDFTLSEDLLQLWTPLLQRLDEAMPSFAEELVMGMLERLDVEEGGYWIFHINV